MENIVLQKTIIAAVDKIIQKEQFVKNILQDIVLAGGKMLLVGGSVRDIIWGKEYTDLDFEVYYLESDVLQAILQKYGRVDVVGKSFGVFKLHGCNADFALPRTDGAGRKPIVVSNPFLKYEQAFVRRDLTMNAMGIDLQSLELIDIFGGVQDIAHTVLRAPDVQFFIQDPLRLFRVMQFVGRFEMTVDSVLSQACARMSIDDVAQERIYQEFHKLFVQSVRPSLGLRWLQSIGRWRDCFSECTDFEMMCQAIDACGQEQDAYKKEVLCWTVLFVYTNLYQEKKYKELKTEIFEFVLQQKITESVMALLQGYDAALHAQDDFTVKMLAWTVQPHSVQDIVQLLQVTQKQELSESIKIRAQKNNVLQKPILPLLVGLDIIEFAQGKKVGELLRVAYELQMRFGITDKQELLACVRASEK